MDQAIATTPTDTPRDAFQHAHAVVGAIIPLLDQRPFAVEIEEDWPAGFRVHLKFRETRAVGLLEFATLVDVPVTRAETAFGIHLDAIARIENVEVRGSAIVSSTEAALLEGASAPESTALTPDATAPAQAATLGSSVLAELPAIVSVLPAPAVHLEHEDEACCVRCGCTENAACLGGCYWVPNRQMVDLCSACATPEELAAMTPAPAPASTPRLASPLMGRIAIVPAEASK
ncbi:hypothetical protein [Streptomyces sp. NPDC005732]|uniref:hypothetical protein n=1 Tax=Streptomyces sp. NPDC005732 TaxID=3157057 RepID=UPI0033C8EEE5